MPQLNPTQVGLLKQKLRDKLRTLSPEQIQQIRQGISPAEEPSPLSTMRLPAPAQPAASTDTAIRPQPITGLSDLAYGAPEGRRIEPTKTLSPTRFTESALGAVDKLFGVPKSLDELNLAQIPRTVARGVIGAAGLIPSMAEQLISPPEGQTREQVAGEAGKGVLQMFRRFPIQVARLAGIKIDPSKPLNPIDKFLIEQKLVQPETMAQIEQGLLASPEEPFFSAAMASGLARGLRPKAKYEPKLAPRPEPSGRTVQLPSLEEPIVTKEAPTKLPSVGKEKPSWWDEPSDNTFAKDMTQGEVITDWLARHEVPKENGKYVFYHATPVKGGATTNIRKGSYLAEDAATAKQQATRDRGAKAGEIQVIKVLVNPEEIHTGVWATLRNDIDIPPTPQAKLPSAKQPYEMTKAEFEKNVPITPISKSEASNVVEGGLTFRYDVPVGIEDIVGYAHKRNIQRALHEGKPVPPEVLKDYPDLQAKAGEAIKKTEPVKAGQKVFNVNEQNKPVLKELKDILRSAQGNMTGGMPIYNRAEVLRSGRGEGQIRTAKGFGDTEISTFTRGKSLNEPWLQEIGNYAEIENITQKAIDGKPLTNRQHSLLSGAINIFMRVRKAGEQWEVLGERGSRSEYTGKLQNLGRSTLAHDIPFGVGLAAIPTIAALSDEDTRDRAVGAFGLAGTMFLGVKSGAKILRAPKDIGITSAVRTPTNLFGAIPGQKANYGRAAQEASRSMALAQRNEIVKVGFRDERYATALKPLLKNKAKFGNKLEKAFDIIEEPTGKLDKNLTPEELKAVQSIRQESKLMKDDLIQRQRERMRGSVTTIVNREWRSTRELKGVKLKESQRAELTEAINQRLGELVPSEGWGIENYLRHLHPGYWDVWAETRNGKEWVGATTTVFGGKSKIVEHLANNPTLKPTDFSMSGRAFKGWDVVRISNRRYFKIVNDIARATDQEAAQVGKSLMGKIGTKEGRQKFAGFLQKREGFEGFRKDLPAVLDVMNVEFERYKTLTDLNRPILNLAQAARKEGRPNVATEIEAIFQHMWGRTPSKVSKLVDASLQKIPGVRDYTRPLFYERAAARVKNASYVGFIKLSPRFRLLLNRLQTYQTLAPTVSFKEWRDGTKFAASKEGRTAMDKFGVRFLSGGKFLSERGIRRGQEIGKKPGLLADEARNIEKAWSVLYDKGKKMGMSEVAANDYAFLKGVLQTQFLHLSSDVPSLLRGPTTSTIFQFQRFPIKNLELGYQLLADRNYPGAAKWIGAQVLFAGAKWATSPVRLLGGAGAAWLGVQTYDKIRDEYGQYVADLMTWGLPGLLGLDMSYSFQLVNTPYGQNVPEKIGNMFLGPVGNVAVSTISAAFDTEGVETSPLKRSLYAAASRVPSLRWIESLRALQNKTDNGEYSFKDASGREKFKGDLKDVIVKGLGGRTTKEAEIDMIIEAATEVNSVRDKMLDQWAASAIQTINADKEVNMADIQDWNELWPDFPVDVASKSGIANLRERLKRRLKGQDSDKLTRKLESMPTILKQFEEYRRANQ